MLANATEQCLANDDVVGAREHVSNIHTRNGIFKVYMSIDLSLALFAFETVIYCIFSVDSFRSYVYLLHIFIYDCMLGTR